MNSQVIITKDILFDKEYVITALMSENRMTEVNCEPTDSRSVLGNVYVGRVKKIVNNIMAAFIELWPGQMGYLPLADVKEPLMVRQSREGLISEGDELVVQVAREAIKSKDPALSTNISLTGKYVVLTSENKKFGISKKLNTAKRDEIRRIFGNFENYRFGVIIRTNAGNDSVEKIFADFHSYMKKMNHILDNYQHRTCYSCLYESPPDYIASLRSYPSDKLFKIQTDDLLIYHQLLEECQEDAFSDKLRLYEDEKITLASLYGIKFKLQDAIRERVWLKSGAYLIIQPTEALTVIDVNSGKNLRGKKEDYFLRVNLEAAEETALQLRLRNISGICIVDFINLDTEGAQEVLLREFRKWLHQDPVKTELIDMTKLGLVEITRKKIKKSLLEQIK